MTSLASTNGPSVMTSPRIDGGGRRMRTGAPAFAEPSDYIVQVWSDTSRFLGSGFFVAPRVVATCAHVVEGHQKLVIRWSGPDFKATVLVAEPPGRDGQRN